MILEEREGRDIVGCRWCDLWGLPKFGGSVAPFFDDRLLDNTRVGLAIDTNLLGNLDTIGFGHESKKREKSSFRIFTESESFYTLCKKSSKLF